ncbi:MAG: LuxR C-terminal-related transcriptional regulator [Armatimonadota bacterium]
MARDRMLIRYNMRGTGLSERKVSDFSLGALVLDVEAVDQDWELMTDTCAHIVLGWSGGELGRRAAMHLRESVTQEVARAALDALRAFDVTHLLPEVKAPTLVVHRQGIPWLPVDIARDLASAIRGARLMLLGESTAPYLGDTEAAARAIDEFLGGRRPTGAREDGKTAGLRGTPEQEPDLEEVADGRQARAGTSRNGLTEREAQVLRFIAGGRTNREIAGELVLSVRTVERHIANIYGKIGARGRADATVYALTHGLI